MAFITADQTRNIKARLKKAYPKFKFSVRNSNHSSVDVTIVSGPIKFGYTDDAIHRMTYKPETKEFDYCQINHYYTENYTHSDILEGIVDIIQKGNHDNSDIMTDYFDVGWYVHLSVGAWNKPYLYTGK